MICDGAAFQVRTDSDGPVNGTALDSGYIPDARDEISTDVGAVGMMDSFYGRLSVAPNDAEKYSPSDLPPTCFRYGSVEFLVGNKEKYTCLIKKGGDYESKSMD